RERNETPDSRPREVRVDGDRGLAFGAHGVAVDRASAAAKGARPAGAAVGAHVGSDGGGRQDPEDLRVEVAAHLLADAGPPRRLVGPKEEALLAKHAQAETGAARVVPGRDSTAEELRFRPLLGGGVE